ncbi:DODA-type extradiol aromatic ring-opening family dioxygenase [Marinomonas transparens]|uniref:Dioxygenase n=1 Tax=Marinomonas transparens TaxID=2795388 RepID=A0A934N2Z9_9GAMM|nr:class III extradiol ring-cleavage dioxygenase [Marinomonas transparens]MBJ7538418.1 dioxygenase [Marinomonas transparens]
MPELNSTHDTNELMPVIYVPHGAGPMPLMGEPGHKDLIGFLKNIHTELKTPKAILIISGHWEGKVAMVSSSPAPKMFYDYGGFPPETYEYQYPAPGNPAISQEVADLLKSHHIDCVLDDKRGYDHGVFVPLMLMYPNADIPVVQLSLLNSLDPAKHIALGEAITSLRQKGVLIVGSGMTFHERDATFDHSVQFDHWLTETLTSTPIEQAKEKLTNWASAPAARNCHRREDHLLPLHVCFGAAISNNQPAERIYSGSLFGWRHSGFLWR